MKSAIIILRYLLNQHHVLVIVNVPTIKENAKIRSAKTKLIQEVQAKRLFGLS